MGYYEFKADDAIRFAAAHAPDGKYRERGNELQFYKCPYCKGGSRPDKWTFAISLENGAYNCKRSSCGKSGSFREIAREFGFSLGSDVDEYYYHKRKFRELPQPKVKHFTVPEAERYLEGRGISRNTAIKYGVTTKAGTDNILLFPCYNPAGKLVNVKYRKTDFSKEKGDNCKEWFEKDCQPILFGMWQCDTGNKTVVITEGEIDAMSVNEAGIGNAMSVIGGKSGMTWIPQCYDWLHANFETIIVFGDYEDGHLTLVDDISASFHDMRVMHVREEDYKDCKDANDILRKYGKEQVRLCVENAEPNEVGGIIEVADVVVENSYKKPKVATGIRLLDKMLYGGLPCGGVTVITGKMGEGKSTMSSQVIVSALSQGYSCFIYSGELENGDVREILDFQIAGPNHIITENSYWGDPIPDVTQATRDRIGSWYRGRLFMKDSKSYLNKDDEQPGLLQTVEKAICQLGCKVVLLDNLMTVMNDEYQNSLAYNKNDTQGIFVKRLRDIAAAYDALILLVAHKRKSNGLIGYEGDEVSGSSDIGNLAMCMLSYGVTDNPVWNGSEKEKLRMVGDDYIQRRIAILKNRKFGKKGELSVNYDAMSHRIYGKGDDMRKDYGAFEDADDSETTSGEQLGTGMGREPPEDTDSFDSLPDVEEYSDDELGLPFI